MTAPDYLDLEDGRRLAYHRTPASGEGVGQPTVVFLGGFASDMTGTKATHLEAWARARGRGFLRFDYTGHGASSGTFEEGGIGDWARDAEDALTRLTEGPLTLVGSSMGGWIALLMAKRMPGRLAGLVGVAAAPDFTEDSILAGLDEVRQQVLIEAGRIELPSDYGDPLVITSRLIVDGRDHLVLRTPLAIPCPLRLLQGTADVDVPVSVALRLLDHVDCADARLTLVRGADHRFSEPSDLSLLTETIAGLPAA